MNQEIPFTYIVYHKPKMVVCTTEKIEGNIIDAINHSINLLPIGRLDKDSEGLILLTNDKKIINKIIHPSFEHEKEYEVTLNLPLRNEFIKRLENGVNIGDAITKPTIVKRVPNTKRVFKIILKQGLNRQIRRMCAVFGYQIIKLKRIRIMNIHLEDLKPNEWRNLTEEELKELLVVLN
ncbi:MAG: pseudouridine synthase [Bacteroidia bacterium]